MQRYIESTGKTEEAAIAAALEQLGLTRDEVSVEVLELAKPGFLGIGGTLAKVRVTFEAPDEPEEEEEVKFIPAWPAKEEPADKEDSDGGMADALEIYIPRAIDRAEADVPAPKAAPAPDGDALAAKITDFITGLMAHMGVTATAQVSVDDQGCYLVELVGEGLGAVIGRRGETLDAIQQLTGYAVNHGHNDRVRVRVDAEGYRAKRESSLEAMARRTAEKAIRFRRNITLEPMNAYERHVVHTALQDYPDVTTYSIGTEPNRRTVVAYAPGEHRE